MQKAIGDELAAQLQGMRLEDVSAAAPVAGTVSSSPLAGEAVSAQAAQVPAERASSSPYEDSSFFSTTACG